MDESWNQNNTSRPSSSASDDDGERPRKRNRTSNDQVGEVAAGENAGQNRAGMVDANDQMREEIPREDQNVARMGDANRPIVIDNDSEMFTEHNNDEEILDVNSFDRMLLHEDFNKLLTLSTRIKAMKNCIAGKSIPPRFCDLSEEEMKETTKLIKQQMCKVEAERVVSRGMCRQTDQLMDEAMSNLSIAFKQYSSWLEYLKKNPKKRGEGGAIAVKYSKKQTDILTDWMIKHREHPFPDSNQIKALCKATTLSYSQVVNWTTNVRKRNLKATVEGGKKPHHFLDFLFLAQDRERKQSQAFHPGTAPAKRNTAGSPKKRGGKKSPARNLKAPPLKSPPEMMNAPSYSQPIFRFDSPTGAFQCVANPVTPLSMNGGMHHHQPPYVPVAHGRTNENPIWGMPSHQHHPSQNMAQYPPHHYDSRPSPYLDSVRAVSSSFDESVMSLKTPHDGTYHMGKPALDSRDDFEEQAKFLLKREDLISTPPPSPFREEEEEDEEIPVKDTFLYFPSNAHGKMSKKKHGGAPKHDGEQERPNSTTSLEAFVFGDFDVSYDENDPLQKMFDDADET